MNRYLLFVGDTYYPSGGWDDFIGPYDSVSDAWTVAVQKHRDWAHVVDSTTGQQVVEDATYGYGNSGGTSRE